MLCRALKSRDADHLICLVYDAGALDADILAREIEEARHSPEKIEVPDYALDVHTRRGRKRGRTRREFFIDEFDALRPREPGLFDDDVERLRVAAGRHRPGSGEDQQSVDAAPQGRERAPRPQENGNLGCDVALSGSGTTRRRVGMQGRIRYVDPKRETFSEAGWQMRGLTSSGK
jgi:hypothetical protein